MPQQTGFKPNSQNSVMLARLQQTPGEWVPEPELARLCHCHAINSRATNLREAGFNVENRVEQLPGYRKHSFYRLIPPGFALQADLPL